MKEELEGWMLTICFDIDGTLLDFNSVCRVKMVQLAKSLLADRMNRVFFWSGGGIQYAMLQCRRMGLPEDRVIAKGSFRPDITIDDQDVNLGFTNLKISQ